MTAHYFRALATECNKAARDCFDLFAKEEFRRLANEFKAKADELDGGSTSGWWHLGSRAQFIDR